MSSSHTFSLSSSKRVKVDIIKRTRFFHVIDHRDKKFIFTICKEKNVSLSTSKKWLRQRKQLRSTAASRRVSKNRAEGSVKVTSDQLNEMLNVKKNLVRDQTWEIQINHFQLNCTSRTIKKVCKRRFKKASRYRMIKVKKLNEKNKKLRVEYDHRHVIETMNFFWQYVHFIDEAHFDLDEIFSKRVLREESTRFESENMQIMSDMKEVKLHFAISIFWHHKNSLQFYNDEHDSSLVVIKKLLKSRRSRYQTKKTYQQRIVEWKTSLSHDSKIKLKRNSMTQTYYTDRLLSVYAQIINEDRVFHDRMSILQEDNDNNHDIRSKDNVVVRFKATNWIDILIHSSQSLDLNSCESVWNILTQRVKRRQWRIVSELKQMILNEWNKIIMNKIRNRINEMSQRCKILIENENEVIKSDRW